MSEYKKGGRYFKKTALTSALLAMTALSGQAFANHNDDDDRCGPNPKRTMTCDVAIVGGGPAGTYAAYELTLPANNINPGTVCLFEKNNYLGGRIIDKKFADKKDADSGITGTAAYRMYRFHYTNHLYDKVLGMDANNHRENEKLFQAVSVLNTPAGVKKAFYGCGDDSFTSFFGVVGGPDTECKIYDALLCGAGVHPSKQIPLINVMAGVGDPDFDSLGNISSADYLKNTVGTNRAEYFKSIYRFKSDFQLDVDAAAYMKYLSEDFATYSSGDPIYAIPGHSVLMNAMEDQMENRVKIKKNETVHKVERKNQGSYKYQLITDNFEVKAKRVILATDAPSLKNIKGDVINDITKQKFYKAIIGPEVVTVTNQWNTKWWITRQADLQNVPGSVNSASGDDIRRGISNVKVDGKYCLTNIELSTTNHHDNLQVGRSVYTDDSSCSAAWNKLYEDHGIAAVNQKVLKGLRMNFPKVFDGSSNEPKIVDTKFTHVPAAWFIIKEGSAGKGITNETLDSWSRNPIPGEQVYLIGDSYNISFGWSASAFMSAARLIDMLYPSVDLNSEFSTTFGRVKCKDDGMGNREVSYDHL